MKLSIVTINYNNVEGLRKTLASVAAQTYRDIEHIIVDAVSSDGSVDVIKEYVDASKHAVIWSSEKDKGIYDGMNRGIRKATGEYIQILNSGDILAAPDVTERMMDALAEVNREELIVKSGGVPILYGNMMKDMGDGQLVRDNCEGTGPIDGFLYFYVSTLNHDCAYIRRDLFDKYGLYNEEMKICSDWEWYVRAIALGGEKPIYTNIDVTIFDMNGISESGGKNKELIKQEKRAYLEKILIPSILHDYDSYTTPVAQYLRLKKHHLWGFVNFIERVLFKLEKWKILRS